MRRPTISYERDERRPPPRLRLAPCKDCGGYWDGIPGEHHSPHLKFDEVGRARLINCVGATILFLALLTGCGPHTYSTKVTVGELGAPCVMGTACSEDLTVALRCIQGAWRFAQFCPPPVACARRTDIRPAVEECLLPLGDQ